MEGGFTGSPLEVPGPSTWGTLGISLFVVVRFGGDPRHNVEADNDEADDLGVAVDSLGDGSSKWCSFFNF